MRKLELNFQEPVSASTWPGWLLLIAGILLCADTTISYTRMSSETKRLEQSINNDPSAYDQNSRTPTAYSTEEYAEAVGVVDCLSLPWGDVFSVLESNQTEGIGILEFTPTPKDNSMILRGEAASFPALLTYIAGLEQTATFYDVILEKHEIKPNEPHNSIAFALSAHWKRK